MDIGQVKGMLGTLSDDAARAARAGKNIVAAAKDRLGIVEKRMAELRPTVLTDQAAADEYEALTSERGQLNISIGRGK